MPVDKAQRDHTEAIQHQTRAINSQTKALTTLAAAMKLNAEVGLELVKLIKEQKEQ